MVDNSPDSFIQKIFHDQNSPEHVFDDFQNHQQQTNQHQQANNQGYANFNQPSSTTSPGSFSINSSNPIIQYSPRNNCTIQSSNISPSVSKLPSPLQNSSHNASILNNSNHARNAPTNRSISPTNNWTDFSMNGYNEFKRLHWAHLKQKNPDLDFTDYNSMIAEEWSRLKEINKIITKKPSFKKRKHDEASLDGSLIGLAGLPRPPSSLGSRSLASKSGIRSAASRSITGKSVVNFTPKPFCEICNKEFSSGHNYNTHINSKPHLKMMQQLQKLQSPVATIQSQNHLESMVLSPTMPTTLQAMHLSSVHSRRGSSLHPSVTTSGIHHSNQIIPKSEKYEPLMFGTNSLRDNRDEMSSGTKESDRKFELSDHYFGLRSLAEQIKEKVKSRQDQVNKIRLEIIDMEKSPSYQAIQKHKICSKQLQDLTSAFQSLRMKYRKNDDEQLALKSNGFFPTYKTTVPNKIHDTSYNPLEQIANQNFKNAIQNHHYLQNSPQNLYDSHQQNLPPNSQSVTVNSQKIHSNTTSTLQNIAPHQSSITHQNNAHSDSFQPYRDAFQLKNFDDNNEQFGNSSEASSVKESYKL